MQPGLQAGVHGGAEGAQNVRRGLSDWMRIVRMKGADAEAELDRYIGHWEPYATSHEARDEDYGSSTR